MKHVASFVNEQFSRLGSVGKLENRTTSRLLFATIALAVLLLFAAGVVRAQADPFHGTWKLNVSKSKFVPGSPRKSETRLAESSPMGLQVSIKRVKTEMEDSRRRIYFQLGRQKLPHSWPRPLQADTIAANLTAPNTIQSTLQKDGKVIATATSVVSKNGKVLTITTKGVDASGKPFNNVAVYDKQ